MRYFPLLVLCLVTAIRVSAVPVTFKVNLGVKVSEGVFDAATDSVEVRGAFNAWAGGLELTDGDNDKVFEGTFELGEDLVGQAQEYKFVYIKLSDGVPVWESINNRSFIPTATAQTLETVFFNNDEVVSVTIKGEILFTVDLAVQISSGNFNKTADEVYVRGNKMGWGAPPEGLKLVEDAARPGTYTNTFGIESIITGDLVEYKFTIWRPATSATVWEDGANKTLAFEGSEPDADGDGFLELPANPVYFNGIAPDDALGQETAVTFSVNMQGALRMDGTPFNPGFEGVWVNGNFANWWAWGNAPAEYQLVDDGTSGDATAGDLIYSLEVILPRGAGRMLDYKYAIDSQDNEAGFADNHVRYVRADGTFDLPRDVFGQMTKETPDGSTGDIGAIAIGKSGNGSVTLVWTAGAGVRVQRTPSLVTPAWAEVAGSVSTNSVSVPASGTVGFFRLFRP